MIKFITGLLIGLSIISVVAENKTTVANTLDIYVKTNDLVKILAHLDTEELQAIKEACK